MARLPSSLTRRLAARCAGVARRVPTQIRTALIILAALSLYECLKQLTFPGLSLWQSHALTIVLGTVAATIATHVQRTRLERLRRLAVCEVEQRRRAEEVLQRAHQELNRLVEERTAKLTLANRQLNREVLERRRAEARLKAERDRAQLYLDIAGVMIVALNEQGRVMLINRKGCAMLGWEEPQILRRDWFETCLPERLRAEVKAVFQQLMAGDVVPVERYQNPVLTRCGEERLIAFHNTVIRDATGHICGILFSGEDITERAHVEHQLMEKQRHLDHLAYHDLLTGLPNRLLFQDRLRQALAKGQRNKTMVALMFLDLDRFKNVNDTLGHATGDRLIQVVARRLLACVRQDDTVARLGGDEFTVLLEGIHHSGGASSVARKILYAMSEPVTLDGRELFIGTSIGISLYPTDGEDAESLTRHADAAMYLAKDRGRGNYQFFTENLNRKVVRQLTLETRLRRALDRDELSLSYQPQVDLASGRVVSAEALLRWSNPEIGRVSPAEFIPVAEESGLIVPIGEWVLRTACAQARAWHDAGLGFLRVAVNLSARQMRQPGLPLAIDAILDETRLPPHCLELELTESMLLHDTESTLRLLMQWQEMGIYLSIDDFGTGYSSLSYLKRLPVHHLKVAQEFVRDIPLDPNDAAIARAIVLLAKSLGLQVIAEGVETSDQLRFFQTLACEMAQGYLFSRPVAAQEFGKLLASKAPLTSSMARVSLA